MGLGSFEGAPTVPTLSELPVGDTLSALLPGEIVSGMLTRFLVSVAAGLGDSAASTGDASTGTGTASARGMGLMAFGTDGVPES